MLCVAVTAVVVTLLVVTRPWDSGHGSITNGICLCGVNVTETVCDGIVVARVDTGDCVVYLGETATCPTDGALWFLVQNLRQVGWVPGEVLVEIGSHLCHKASYPQKEFRGLWLATVVNIDWPASASSSPATQQHEMKLYLDIMQGLNMNAIIFQVRPAGDAFYSSTLEPWSRYLTGRQGREPFPLWDPLDFVIREAHARGIEVHAWLNPYRANMAPNWDGLAPTHVANRLPEFAYPYGTYLWMDPGSTQVADHLEVVLEDLATRYDLDGIHFDDYFYPYPVDGVDFPDNITWVEYEASGGELSRADWRRDNVNKMVSRAYNLTRYHGIKFSVSPFGLYRPGARGGMTAPITGFDPYNGLYADAKTWLQRGWLDYLVPQLYWAVESTDQNYNVLLSWWLHADTAGRHILPGNAVYKLDRWPVTELVEQMAVSRRLGAAGNVLFSAKYFRDNVKNVRQIFKESVYPNKTLPPEAPWVGLPKPRRPSGVKVDRHGLIRWERARIVRFWVVYEAVNETWRLSQVLDAPVTSLRVCPGSYAIRAVNKASQESDAAFITFSPIE